MFDCGSVASDTYNIPLLPHISGSGLCREYYYVAVSGHCGYYPKVCATEEKQRYIGVYTSVGYGGASSAVYTLQGGNWDVSRSHTS